MAKQDRGFASMTKKKQQEIASKGGKAAHAKGTAHEWTLQEAREAGRKGGLAAHQNRANRAASDAPNGTQAVASGPSTGIEGTGSVGVQA